MKQTAVDWLIDTLGYKDESGKICINIHPDCDITPEIKRAKQMEKEQIKEAHQAYLFSSSNCDAEEYYKKTYNDNK